MPDNQKLIEAIAAFDATEGVLPDKPQAAYAVVEAARLAVIEKAHTPTDDEREKRALERYEAALGTGLSDHEAREEGWPTRHGKLGTLSCHAGCVTECSEVPEPSAETLTDVAKRIGASERLVARHLPLSAPSDTAANIVRHLTEVGLLRRPEAPAPVFPDQSIAEAVEIMREAETHRTTRPEPQGEPPTSENAYTGIPLSEVIRSEQGEPSDAQVAEIEQRVYDQNRGQVAGMAKALVRAGWDAAVGGQR